MTELTSQINAKGNHQYGWEFKEVNLDDERAEKSSGENIAMM